jgi:MFS family permease
MKYMETAMATSATGRKGLSELRGMPLQVSAAAFIAWTLANMDQSLFGYAVPLLMKDFGIGIDAIGLMLSASFVFAIFSVTVIGVLTDIWGRRLMLGLMLGLSAICVGAQAFAPGILLLAMLRVLGFGLSAGLSPITSALVAESSPARLRPLLMAILQCAYPFGWFVASLLIAPILPTFGWRGMFLIAFAVVPIAYILYRMVPERTIFGGHAAAKAQGSPIRELFGPVYRRRAIFCALAYISYGGATAGTTFYLPTFFETVRGYTPQVAALLVGAAYAVATIGYIGGALVGGTRFGRRRAAALWAVLGGLGMLATIWLPRSLEQDFVAFGVTTIFFYGTSCLFTIYLVELFPTRLRATGAAVCGSAALSIGFSIFPILVAKTVQHVGWQWAFSIIVVPAALVAGMLMLATGELEQEEA